MSATRPWSALATRLMTLGLVLMACLPIACARRATGTPRTVTFWVTEPIEAVAASVRRFEAATPGVVVELVSLPAASAADSLAAALAANHAPDLCQLHDAQVGPLMAAGVLSDWSAGVADRRADLRGWDLCMQGDAILGLPWLVRTRVLVMDSALAARAHVDASRPPASLAALRTTALAMSRLGHGVQGVGIARDDSGASVASVLPFLWSEGGELANATRDTSWLASAANRGALETLQTLRPALMLAPQAELERAFRAGRLGLVIAAPGFVARLAAQDRARAVVVGCVPRGTSDARPAVGWLGGEVLASFTGSRHKEDALKLARFLVSPPEAEAVARAGDDVLPATIASDTTAWVRTSVVRSAAVAQIASARAVPVHGQWPAMERVLARAFADVLTGRRSAADALASADTLFAAHLRQR